MKRRGGYIPTCDHGVPEEADFDTYIYYRKYCSESDVSPVNVKDMFDEAGEIFTTNSRN